MSKSKVRVGIVGTGVGLRTMLPAFAKLPGAEVTALVGSSEKRAREFADAHGIRYAFGAAAAMYEHEELDLVCIATPTKRHYEDIQEALEQRVAVLAEKPLAMTPQEAETLAEGADEAGVLAMVDHQLRFNPYVKRTAELIRDGSLGDVYLIRIHQQSQAFVDPASPWTWSFEASEGGGLRFAMGPHLVDLIRYWLPDRPVEAVSCALHPAVSRRVGPDGDMRSVAVSGSVASQLRFDGGISAMLTTTAAAHTEPRFEFDVYGSDGEVHFSLPDKLTGRLRSGDDHPFQVEGVREEEQRNEVSIFKGSFVYFAPKLVAAVEARATSLDDAATFWDALDTQKVLGALLDSATQGSLVTLNGRPPGRESF